MKNSRSNPPLVRQLQPVELIFNRLPFIFIVVLFCYSISFSPAFAQPNDLQFEHLNTRNGLSQDIITCICRDGFGFLWIGTEDGLNRYDGYSITSYKHNVRDSNTLSSNQISGVCDYGEADLLVTTLGGINQYDRAKNRFVTPKGALAQFAKRVCGLPVRDHRGRYWMVMENNNILRYDSVLDTIVIFSSGSISRAETFEVINSLAVDNEDSIWITTDKSFAVFRDDSSGFQHYKINDKQVGAGRAIMPKVLTKDKYHRLWVGTSVGLYRYDRNADSAVFIPLRFRFGGSVFDRDNITGGLSWDHQGRLWIGGFNELYCFNPASGNVGYYRYNPGDPLSLQSSRIYALYVDEASVLWVGTWRGGLSKANLRKERFGHQRHTLATPFAGGSSDAFSIYEDSRERLWIGSQADGITRIDPHTKEYKVYGRHQNDSHSVNLGQTTSIVGDSNGTIWIGTDGNIVKYDQRQDAFARIMIPANKGSGLNIQVLYTDHKGFLWIGIERLGVARYDPRTKVFTYFNAESPDTASHRITGAWMFFENHHGIIWMGGWGANGELHSYNPATNEVRNFFQPELRFARTMFEDSNDIFWIGTWGYGMSRFDYRTGEIKQYLEQDGLPSNYIKGMLSDSKGNLWISSERGLSRFTPATESFRNYDVTDGLQGNLFYSGSCLKGHDGKLYFGGPNGLNAFYADSIRDEEYNPEIVITQFRVFDKPYPVDRPFPLMKSVSLSYREDMFSFEYVSLDYNVPERNRYVYTLEGFDHEWIQAGSRRYASYTHLDPGEYVFKVKGTNSDGVWSSNVAAVQVLITPAFWQTWWFRSGTVLLMIALLYAAYRYRIEKLLEIERTRAAIATDLHDDIGTSLTNIALFSDLAQRDVALGSSEVTHRLEKISQTSRSLLDSMNDIVWSIKPENDGLEQTMLRMEDYAVEMLEENGIDLHVHIPNHLRALKLPMAVRRNLFLIFKEAIGNVLKHARATNVDITIASAESGKRLQNLQVSITDNGKGFNPLDLKRGNGLQNMELRTRNLNGTITVTSDGKKGTRVEIRFPIKSHK